MRIKSVPRHLPRKDSLQGRMKPTRLDSEYSCAIGGSGGGGVSVKMVSFTNYEDIVRKVELVVHQQKTEKFSQQTTSSPIDKFQAVDLSLQTGSIDIVGPAKTTPSSTPPPLMRLSPPRELSRGIDAAATLYNNNNNNESDLKDTYLYQIMTNPELLDKIIREKQQTYSTTSTSTITSSTSTTTTSSKQKTSCPYCKRDFANEAEVKRHLNVQSRNGSSQLLCCACGKSFAQKRYLRYHQRCHSERNKYACDICTRKYSRQDNLTRHNIFHTNPDKFPCGSCERTFARKDLLNKHLKCHENKWKYFCEACKKYFKGPVSLDNHMKLLHAGGKERRGSARGKRNEGEEVDCTSRSSDSASSCGSSRSGEKKEGEV